MGGVVGDGAVTVGNAILPMGKSGGVGRGRRSRGSGAVGDGSFVGRNGSSDKKRFDSDETARTTRSPRWTPESFEYPLGSWNRIGASIPTWIRGGAKGRRRAARRGETASAERRGRGIDSARGRGGRSRRGADAVAAAAAVARGGR